MTFLIVYLCSDIPRARNHVNEYRKRCKSLGIELHPRALFRSPTESSSIEGFNQTSLEGIVTREARGPTFTNAGLMDHVIELIIREDEVSERCLFVCASY
jgi:hypothetical protein